MASPKYIQIRNQILEDIRTGKLKAGEKLPTREEMLEKYSVTRTTIEKAISDLNQRKILKSITKRGTFVSGEAKTIRAAVIFDRSLIESVEVRSSLNDLGLLYYAMLVSAKDIEYQSIDVKVAQNNLRILIEFDVAIWVQPSAKIIEKIKESDVPCLIINRKVPNLNCISTDHVQTAFEVTDYYINKYKEKGIQALFVYSSKSIKIVGKARLEGFVKACAKHNYFYRILDLEGGHFTVTRELLAMDISFEKPVFLLSGSEKYTGAVLKLAREKNLTFGKELFYCDYDNQQSMERTGVEFTSVIQDFYEMGRQISANLYRIGKEPVHIDIPHLITGLQ